MQFETDRLQKTVLMVDNP